MRIRYSLRWLLIGVTLVCSLLAAFAYRAERAWRQAAAVRIINEELGTDAVAYDFQSRQTLDQSANWSYDIKELTPRDFGLGIDFWHGAIQVGHHPYPSPDDEVRFFVALGQLPRLESLELRVPQVRAEHLRQLTCQRSLRFLVWDGEFSDESFAELGDFRQLEAIEFANDHNPDSLANVTDWRPIDAWQTLRFFEAKRAGLGDDAAVHLGNLKKLQQVHVAGNRIGDRGAAALGQLPQLEDA
jgi:hypothetical protein